MKKLTLMFISMMTLISTSYGQLHIAFTDGTNIYSTTTGGAVTQKLDTVNNPTGNFLSVFCTNTITSSNFVGSGSGLTNLNGSSVTNWPSYIITNNSTNVIFRGLTVVTNGASQTNIATGTVLWTNGVGSVGQNPSFNSITVSTWPSYIVTNTSTNLSFYPLVLTTNATVTLPLTNSTDANQSIINAIPKNLGGNLLICQFQTGIYTTAQPFVFNSFYNGALYIYGSTINDNPHTNQTTIILNTNVAGNTQCLSCNTNSAIINVKYIQLQLTNNVNISSSCLLFNICFFGYSQYNYCVGNTNNYGVYVSGHSSGNIYGTYFSKNNIAIQVAGVSKCAERNNFYNVTKSIYGRSSSASIIFCGDTNSLASFAEYSTGVGGVIATNTAGIHLF